MNNRIVSGHQICGGEPCIAGTRVSVSVVLSHLAAGESYQEILKNFPRLKHEDILAVLDYAAFLSLENAIPA